MLSDSSTFLRFWLTDDCRDRLISLLPPSDLASLRLVCHDFSVRAAPALFADLSITFKTTTFKPSRLAALHRFGYHVKTLTFNTPHTSNTFLPPLIHPDTGEELTFTYTPRLQQASPQQPKYGDWQTTDVLTRQYPPLFHAATNVDAFVQAFSAFVNLTHLKIDCNGYSISSRYRRSIVDFVLISIRIAVEKNCLNALTSLTLAPIHPGGLLYLSPLLGYGATPSSIRRWSKIEHLHVQCAALPKDSTVSQEPDQLRLLQTYLSTYRRNLQSFSFRWLDHKGPFPFSSSAASSRTAQVAPSHPATDTGRPSTAPDPTTPKSMKRTLHHGVHFPKLKHLEIENATSNANEVALTLTQLKRTLEELDLKDVTLTTGTWSQAFEPLTKMAVKNHCLTETAEIPIMLSPETTSPAHNFPKSMDRVEIIQQTQSGRKSFRASRWLGGKKSTPTTPRTPLLPSAAAGAASRRVKRSLHDCESQFKRAWRGAGLPWLHVRTDVVS